MKFQESSRFLPVIFSYLPLIVLFSLAAFLYLTYMLVKNLSTSFQTYSKNQTYLIPMFLVGNEQFISIKSLQFSESISQELTVTGNPSFERKKYVLAGVLHALLLFFLISVLRTIFTNPGNVPDVTIKTFVKIYSCELGMEYSNWERVQRSNWGWEESAQEYQRATSRAQTRRYTSYIAMTSKRLTLVNIRGREWSPIKVPGKH